MPDFWRTELYTFHILQAVCSVYVSNLPAILYAAHKILSLRRRVVSRRGLTNTVCILVTVLLMICWSLIGCFAAEALIPPVSSQCSETCWVHIDLALFRRPLPIFFSQVVCVSAWTCEPAWHAGFPSFAEAFSRSRITRVWSQSHNNRPILH